MVICGSFTVGKLLDFIPPHLWLNVPLYFSLKYFGLDWSEFWENLLRALVLVFVNDATFYVSTSYKHFLWHQISTFSYDVMHSINKIVDFTKHQLFMQGKIVVLGYSRINNDLD